MDFEIVTDSSCNLKEEGSDIAIIVGSRLYV